MSLGILNYQTLKKKSIVDFGKSIKYLTNERNKKDNLEVYVFTVCEAHE